MKVLIAVGGGGHFSPALAVIEQMPKDWGVLLVGRKYTFEGETTLSLEYQTAERLHIPFEPLTTGRLQRKLSKHTISSLLKVPVGLAQAMMILRRYKPDVVLSFGGYISVPVALAARVLKVPIVIHEQTLQAGLANKLVAKFADAVCISWEESAKYFPKEKIALTGNPLRKEFLNVIARSEAISLSGGLLRSSVARNDDEKNKIPLIYITGGSGGAHGINALVEGSLPELLKHYRIIHQTGDAQKYGDFSRLEAAKAQLSHELQKRYLIKKFIPSDRVAQILNEADLVIARSGINTVTELLYLGKPCLLVPLPFGQRNEQKTNAQMVEKIGLGKMVEQDELSSESFVQVVDTMISELSTYQAKASEAREKVAVDAADKIIKIVNYEKKAKAAA